MLNVLMLTMKNLHTSLSFLLLISFFSNAAPEAWQKASASKGQTSSALYVLDEEWLLDTATTQHIVYVPNLNGEIMAFAVRDSGVLPPELQQKFPYIKSYVGTALNDSGLTGRFDFSPNKFSALFQDGTGRTHLSITQQPDAFYKVKKESPSHDHTQPDYNLLAPIEIPNLHVSHPSDVLDVTNTGSQRDYRFRLAMATTGEFTQTVGGTVAGGMAEVTSIVNRLNQIFQIETGVQFTLVANNDDIIYTNGSTDPYSNSTGATELNNNQGNLTSVIGTANYDIGHVLTTSGGGVAGGGVMCIDNYKAWGISGSNNNNETGESFWIRVIAHELAHQLDANHIYNATESVCTTRNADTAYEPGSGSTIMSYNGLCGSQNLQSDTDGYFHHQSLIEMQNKLNSIPASCGTVTTTTNTHPTANAGSDYTIPANTYFQLSGQGSDANATDTLSFVWEQADLGQTTNSSNEATTDFGSGPIYRTILPSSSSIRTFPALANIQSGTNSIGEIVPTTARTLNFAFIVRDGQGGITSDNMTVTTVSSSGFSLNTSFDGVTFTANPITLDWNVAGSDQAPVSCANVDVQLSTNGGTNFNSIATDLTNDGNATVNLPTTGNQQDNLMLRVKCSDNIFFAQHTGTFSANISLSDYVVTSQSELTIADGESSLTLAISDFVVSNMDTPTSLTVLSGDNYTVNDTTITRVANFSGNLSVGVQLSDGTNTSDVYFATVTVEGSAPADEPDADDPNNDDDSDSNSDGFGGSGSSTISDAADVILVSSDQAAIFTIGVPNLSATDTLSSATIDAYSNLSNQLNCNTYDAQNGPNDADCPGTVSVSGQNILFTQVPQFSGLVQISYTTAQSSGTLVLGLLEETGSVSDFIYRRNGDGDTEGQDALEDTSIALEIDDFDFSGIFPTKIFIADGANYTFNNNIITPEANFTGPLNFGVRLSDGNNVTPQFMANVNVANVNDAPVANNDAFLVTQNSSDNALQVLVNDFDIDQDDTVAIVNASVDEGSVTFDANQLLYTPDNSFTGTATINYFISDGELISNAATAVITVQQTISSESFSTDEETAITFAPSQFVAPFAVTSVTILSGDDYSVVDGGAMPSDDFSGELLVRVLLEGANDESTEYLVAVDVTNVNDAPIAVDDAFTITEDTLSTFAVLDNDSDPDVSDTLIITAATTSGSGQVNIISGQLSYSPAANFSGQERINYTITDGSELTSSAQVLVTVTAQNDAPTVVNDVAYTNINRTLLTVDVLANDSDEENDLLILTGVTQATNGNAFIRDNLVDYTPNPEFSGIETVNYTVSDGTTSSTGTLTINVLNTPVASTLTVNEEDSFTISTSDFANFDFTVSQVVLREGDNYTLVGNRIIPDANFVGTLSVNVEVSGGGNVVLTQLNVTIQNTNDAPVAVPDALVLNEDQQVFINPTVNDTDIDPDDTMTLSSVTGNAGGSITFEENTITYTPAPNYHGEEVITYTIVDTLGLSSTSTITITINPVDDAPIAVADTKRANINQSDISIDVLSNDREVDNETLTLVRVSTAGDGQVRILNNQIIYTPLRDFTGEEVVTYIVSDGITEVEGTLTINVVDSVVLDNNDHVNSQAGSVSWILLLLLAGHILYRRDLLT